MRWSSSGTLTFDPLASDIAGSTWTDQGPWVGEDWVGYDLVPDTLTGNVTYASHESRTEPSTWDGKPCTSLYVTDANYSGSTPTYPGGYLQLNWLRPYPPPAQPYTQRGVPMWPNQLVLDGSAGSEVPYQGTENSTSSGCGPSWQDSSTMSGNEYVHAFMVDEPFGVFPDESNPTTCRTIYDDPPDYTPHTRDACQGTPSSLSTLRGGWNLTKSTTTTDPVTGWTQTTTVTETYSWTLTPGPERFTTP